MSFLLTNIASTLAKMALEQGVRAALPVIFDQIDNKLPLTISQQLGGDAISGLIGSAISDAVRRPAKTEEIDAVVALYDPRKAAAKRAKKVARRSER